MAQKPPRPHNERVVFGPIRKNSEIYLGRLLAIVALPAKLKLVSSKLVGDMGRGLNGYKKACKIKAVTKISGLGIVL